MLHQAANFEAGSLGKDRKIAGKFGYLIMTQIPNQAKCTTISVLLRAILKQPITPMEPTGLTMDLAHPHDSEIWQGPDR